MPAETPQTQVVIFGASGDLTRRKLVPALIRLAADGRPDQGFSVVGVARRPMSDAEFRTQLAKGVPADLKSTFILVGINGPGGATAVTLVSLPGEPLSLGDAGLWLGLASAIVVDAGVLSPRGVRNLKLPISPAFPLGVPLMFQSGIINSGQLFVSTPDLVIVR